MKLETIAVHAGNTIDQSNKAAIQPITLSTTFERGTDGGYPGGYVYTRAGNPNRKSLENVLAKLEQGIDAAAFSSGNAAGTAVFQALEPGSHVIVANDMYHGLRNCINEVFKGVLEVDHTDLSDLELLQSTIRQNTKLIWVETPSNPLLKITDLQAIVRVAHSLDIIVVCDNTFATPIFQNPLLLGVDIVMHSTTKYLGGHSDVLGGALITREINPFWERVRRNQEMAGAVPSPFDCYLTVRGIKTLPYRMRGHAENAKRLAEYLSEHPGVEKVFFPGLASHPGYEIASRQMSSFGGMLSFLVKEGETKARMVASATRVFTQATSLGGVESLIEHRASLEGPHSKTPTNLLRVSVGLENVEDLIDDLQQAIGWIEG